MYLYAITDGTLIKIGISQDAEKRLSVLQVGNPKRLSLLFSFDFETRDLAERIEQLIHNRIQDRIVRGEWFYVHPFYLLEVFQDICEVLDALSITRNAASRIMAYANNLMMASMQEDSE